jgi:anaerobic ribonucleoside-triphosphate reductase
MISSIIKRDGRVVLFDMEKIAAAVEKALQSTSYYDRLSDEEQENYHSFAGLCGVEPV